MRLHLFLLALMPLWVVALDSQVPLSGPKQGITKLPREKVLQWVHPAWWAGVVYCKNKNIQNWTCGEPCKKLNKPEQIVVGGDGGWNPRWLVASLPSDTLLVSVAGTDAASNLSVSIDLDFKLVDSENTYFPGSVKQDIQFHQGFYNAFKRIIPDLNTAVQAGVNDGAKTIIVTGHSLGGALTYLVGTYLQKRYKDATVYIRAFAPPRVGNKAWADYVDNTFGLRAQHMVNFQDAVPHLPPRINGFWRPSWEVWQQPSDEDGGSRYWLCEGQENLDCSDQAYSPGREVLLLPYFVNQLGVAQHLGPYVNVTLSNIDCPK